MVEVATDLDEGKKALRHRIRYGVVISLLMLGGFGVTGSPYYRIGPGPVIRIPAAAGGSWSVTTVVVRHSTWFQWALAGLNGERVVRGGAADPAMGQAMDTSQTDAALVAAQMAGRRIPTGSAGLQVTEVRGTAVTSGLHPGDVLLAAGHARDLTPLRTQADLWSFTARAGDLWVVVARRTAGESLGRSEIERMPAASLAAVRADPGVSATAYPLGVVQGPSAGLVLTLARVDALGSGGLTGGRNIAGTGGISLDSSVTEVGDVAEKVRAAVASRADVFFVPSLQRDIAVRAARGSTMRIVPVRSVSDAVRWLCAADGHSTVCKASR